MIQLVQRRSVQKLCGNDKAIERSPRILPINMQRLLEQQNAVKFGVRMGWTPTQTRQHIDQAYGAAAMSRARVFHWHKVFREDLTTPTTDAPRVGGPRLAGSPENIAKVRTLVDADRRITLARICYLVNISMGSAHAIMRKDLKLKRIAAKFVPRLLTAAQKQIRVDTCQANLDRLAQDRDLMKRVITGDETWVSCFEPESKQSSSQWLAAGEARPRKSRTNRSTRKTMMTAFFDHQGLIHVEFLPHGETINAAAYRQVLARLREQIRKKRPQLWNDHSVVIHHDNAKPHTAHGTVARMMETDLDTLDHPPYSPDMAPCDFFLFPHLKKHLRGHHFNNIQEVQAAAVDFLSTQIPDHLYRKAIQDDLPKRWQKCVDYGGQYFEGVKNLQTQPNPPEDGEDSDANSISEAF